jgi:hypothetical protein
VVKPRPRGRDSESGKIKVGGLITLLIVVAVIYYGIGYIEVRLKAYQMQDEVTEQATFGSVVDDNTIRRRLVERAIQLDVPIGPRQWSIQRVQMPQGRRLTISGSYTDSVVIRLPGNNKVIYFKFTPSATASVR